MHAVDRFLLFGRNLLEQSTGENLGDYDSDTFNWRGGANNALTANESDEAALEFLYKHAGNVSRAEFHVATHVSSGAGDRKCTILLFATLAQFYTKTSCGACLRYHLGYVLLLI